MNEGFQSYLDTGEIKPEFLEDFYYLTKKIYCRWKLHYDFEEFHLSCTEKLIRRLPHYDANIAPIQTFVYSLVMNEASRIHSASKNLSDFNLDEYLEILPPVNSNKECQDLLDCINHFSEEAFMKGLVVEPEILLSLYQEESSNPIAQAFIWWRVKQTKSC